MPEIQAAESTQMEKRLDRELLGSMALSVFAAAFEVIVGFCVAHWVTASGTKTTGYLVSFIALCICLVAGLMAWRVRRHVTGSDETRPKEGRRLFMAELDLLAAGLVATLVVAGTLVLVSLRPDS